MLKPKNLRSVEKLKNHQDLMLAHLRTIANWQRKGQPKEIKQALHYLNAMINNIKTIFVEA